VFNLQGSEIIVILLLALVVLGPEKLPDAIRKFSQTYGELKKMGNGFQSELKSAIDEPMREMRETAEVVKRAADPALIAEEAEAEAQLRADADAAAFAGAPDVPIDPAAFEISDPAFVAASENGVSESRISESSVSESSVSEKGVSEARNGKEVNQIALSMARGPIEPVTESAIDREAEPATRPPAGPGFAPPTGQPSDMAPDNAASALTTPPQGVPVGLAPPSLDDVPTLPEQAVDDANVGTP